MLLVSHAARAQVAALALAAAGLAGCNGSDSGSGQTAPRSSGGERIGAPVRLANCRDWERATLRQRLGTLKELRKVLGASTGTPGRGYGRTLDDRKADDLFDRACGRSFAKGFKLYKLYARAAAFSRRRPPQE